MLEHVAVLGAVGKGHVLELQPDGVRAEVWWLGEGKLGARVLGQEQRARGLGGAGLEPRCVSIRSLSSLPTLKNGVRLAGICTSSPVFGLRPMRSAFERTWKVAKEESFTVSPITIASQISSSTISTS